MLAPRQQPIAVPPIARSDPEQRPVPRSRRRRRRALSRSACAGLLAILVLAGFMVAHRQSTVVQLGYEAERVEAQLAIIRKHNDESAVEVARLGSLSRVQSLAEERLGMVRPGNEVLLVTNDQGAHATRSAALGAAVAGDEPELAVGVFGRLWRLLVRLASSPVEAARRGT